MPTFSQITIKFLVDFEETYGLQLVTNENDVFDSNNWTWVATRSAGFEVTTGTPTGNAGETTAINFEAAYDLDFPTDFITTVQNTNEVLIQSETQGLDFISFRATDGDDIVLTNGVDYEVTFENDESPIDISNVDFILTRSPHYVSTPFDFETTLSSTIDVYIWSGNLASVPASPTYTTTKVRPTTNYAEFNTDISNFVDEQLNATPVLDIALTTQITDSTDNEVKWVKYIASYTDPDETIADITGTLIGSSGYGYYLQGVNPTKPANNILTSSVTRKVSRDGFILLPFFNNGTITDIDIDSNGGQINANEVITATDNSNKAVQYLSVDVSDATSDSFITVTFNPSGDSIEYEITDECRYEPKQFVFKNKYGLYDSLTMFKKSNETINITNDDFTNAYISNGAYDTKAHQIQKINIQGKENLTCNSGYINERENELYKEMMLSEFVYLYEGSNFIPVNVKSQSLEFKTRVNDKLVNYTVEFEYAYNTIQNV